MIRSFYHFSVIKVDVVFCVMCMFLIWYCRYWCICVLVIVFKCCVPIKFYHNYCKAFSKLSVYFGFQFRKICINIVWWFIC